MILQTLSKNIGPGSTVLDVGCGSGYLSAALARMVKPGGKVYGIDIVPGLVYLSNENANKDDPHMLSSGELSFLVSG
jgi:protein-L-isoaspartate(D-aspartate) O-methyltransferase